MTTREIEHLWGIHKDESVLGPREDMQGGLAPTINRVCCLVSAPADKGAAALVIVGSRGAFEMASKSQPKRLESHAWYVGSGLKKGRQTKRVHADLNPRCHTIPRYIGGPFLYVYFLVFFICLALSHACRGCSIMHHASLAFTTTIARF